MGRPDAARGCEGQRDIVFDETGVFLTRILADRNWWMNFKRLDV